MPASGADGAVSEDGPGQKNPVWSEGPWGRAAGPLERRCSSAHRPPAQNGDPTRVAGSTKDKGKPTEARAASNGKALSDKPALKPYWGKPTVRNFREGNGNVGIIRSPLRAIALPDQSLQYRKVEQRIGRTGNGDRRPERYPARGIKERQVSSATHEPTAAEKPARARGAGLCGGK